MSTSPTSVADLRVETGADRNRYLVGHAHETIVPGSVLAIIGSKTTGRCTMHVIAPDDMEDLEALASFLMPAEVDEAERQRIIELLTRRQPRRAPRKRKSKKKPTITPMK